MYCLRSTFDQVELYKIAGDDSFIPGGMYQASAALEAPAGGLGSAAHARAAALSGGPGGRALLEATRGGAAADWRGAPAARR